MLYQYKRNYQKYKGDEIRIIHHTSHRNGRNLIVKIDKTFRKWRFPKNEQNKTNENGKSSQFWENISQKQWKNNHSQKIRKVTREPIMKIQFQKMVIDK